MHIYLLFYLDKIAKRLISNRMLASPDVARIRITDSQESIRQQAELPLTNRMGIPARSLRFEPGLCLYSANIDHSRRHR